MLRTFRAGAIEFLERLPKSGQPKIGLTIRSIHSVQERRNIDQLRTRIHEVEIEQLLSIHGRGGEKKRSRDPWTPAAQKLTIAGLSEEINPRRRRSLCALSLSADRSYRWL